MGEEGWCTIESDPGVFTELLKEVGVKDVQVEELFSLDEDSMKSLGEVFGIIFLFKWKVQESGAETSSEGSLIEPSTIPIYFANQVINNACATQAILSIVLNCPDLDIGSELSEFKEFSRDFDPSMKGLAISNLKTVRTAHNSFSPNQQFVLEQSKKAEKDDELYHFVSYIPYEGAIYELDGTKKGPIRRGEINGSWVESCIPVIQSRMQEYSVNEIRFNLMAVVRNRENMYNRDLERLQKQLEELKAKVAEGDETAKTEESLIAEEIGRIQDELAQERLKQQRWKKENIRRKHNYIPFAMEFLKLLASKGELNKVIEKAKEEKRKKMQQRNSMQQQKE